MIGADAANVRREDRPRRARGAGSGHGDVVLHRVEAAGPGHQRRPRRTGVAGHPLGDVAERRGHRGVPADGDQRVSAAKLARGSLRRWSLWQPAQGVPGRRAARRGAGRSRAAEGGRLHVDGLLRRPRAVDRQAVLPLQQSIRPRAAVAGRHDRRETAGDRLVGLLRPRLPARGDGQPLRVQDRPGALRGAAGRGEDARRAHAAHLRHGAGRVERALRVAPRPELVRRAAVEPVPDPALAAHRGVPDTHGAGGLPRRAHQRAAVAGAVPAGPRASCAAGTITPSPTSRTRSS